MCRILVVATILGVLTGTAAAEKRPEIAGLVAVGGAVGSLVVGALIVDETQDVPVGQMVGVAIAAIGPSAGHFYAGEGRRGWKSAAVRGAGLVVFTLAASRAFLQDEAPSGEGHLLPAMVAGGALYVGATIVDWVDAPRAARRANRRTAVVPVVSSKDGVAPGLSLVGSF